MQYSNTPSQLKLIDVRVIEGDTHAIYDLPYPTPWLFTKWIGEDYNEDTERLVNRVRIAFGVDEFTNLPQLIVVPYDENGMECPISSIICRNACSVEAVLNRLGYVLALSVN